MIFKLRPKTYAFQSQVAPLIYESLSLGFKFLERFVVQLPESADPFVGEGGVLFGVEQANRLVALGGVTRDPYLSGAGRVRHVYVLEEFRRIGVGTDLVKACIAFATDHYSLLRLRTDTQTGAFFYESLGFVNVTHESATHEMSLVKGGL